MNDHEDFFDFLATSVMDDEWENAPGFFREVICRKLVKLGKLQLKDDMYYLPDPQNPVPDIVKCGDCVYYDGNGGCPHVGCVVNENGFCSDGVKRNAC